MCVGSSVPHDLLVVCDPDHPEQHFQQQGVFQAGDYDMDSDAETIPYTGDLFGARPRGQTRVWADMVDSDDDDESETPQYRR